MSVPQLRIFKDESPTPSNADKLNELWSLFKDDNAKWIARQECLNLKSVDKIIFVFCVFDGASFEHVKNLKARFKKVKKLNDQNLFKNAKEEIYNKVEMMRGKVSKIFTEKVTHLVTTEVGSAKYHAAGSMKLPVMLAEWVLNVWNESENEDVHATDARFLSYKCPIFHKLVICASGYSEEVKNKIKTLVESEGGLYRGELLCGTTTHLILNEAKGTKYDHAKLWKINVIKSEWIYESIKQGYCIPEKDYILETSNQTSTPTENRTLQRQRKIPDIDLSVINPSFNNSNQNTTKLVNETENNPRSTLSVTALNQSSTSMFMSSTTTNPQQINKALSSTSKPMSNYSDLVKELSSIGKIKLTLFDGIGIYCEIFDPAINEKLKKICNLGGAIRFDEYNSDVTHVIINQVNDAKCKSYIEMNPEVNIVTIDWLISSCKQNQLEDCKIYCVFKNALNSVKTPKKRTRPEKPATSLSINMSNKTFDSDLNDCLSQYLNAEAALMKQPAQQAQAPRPFNTSISLPKTSLTAKLQQYQMQKSEYEQSNEENSNNVSMSSSKQSSNLNLNTSTSSSTSNASSTRKDRQPDPSEIFFGKKFQIVGFDEEEKESIEKILNQKGAIVIPIADLDATEMPSYKNKEQIDFTIFPLITSVRIQNNNPATVYWIKKCCEQNRIIALNEDVFYQPIPKYHTDTPLAECVITISGFGQHEKDNIANLCKLLGAHTQQSLSLKRSNDILANTHLICKQAIGPKYMAAKTWNLPVVCAGWVIECCVLGMKAEEKKNSVENQESIHADLIQALEKIRMQNEENCTNSSYGSNNNYNNNNNTTRGDTTASRTIMMTSMKQDQSMVENNPNDSSLTCHNESKKPRLENEMEHDNFQDDDQEETRHVDGRGGDLNDSDDDLVLAAIENSAKFKKPNETMTNYLTPCNPRLKELRRSEVVPIPISPSTHENNSNTNKFSTPVWMKPESSRPPNYEFKFKGLGCDRALELLKTPDNFNTSKVKNQNGKKPETPLCELFANAIHIASEKSKNPEYWANCYDSPAFEYSFQRKKREKEAANNDEHDGIDDNDDHDDDQIQPTPAHMKQNRQILKNVKVYVSRKLVKCQAELYKIVDMLGGDFSWTYNQDCTHFIYSGKLNDNAKELKTAREDNKVIVGPEWIYACQEHNQHVDESVFLITNGAKSSLASKLSPKVATLQTNEDFMNVDNHEDFSKNANETNADEPIKENVETVLQENLEENKESIQVDLKRVFLDQLQDKLMLLTKSSAINTVKKMGRNKSDINKSELSTDHLSNENKTVNIDDETQLMQHLEFNDMTKLNTNKNAANLNDDEDVEEENLKRRQFNLKRKANMPSNNSNNKLDEKSAIDKSKLAKSVGKQAKFNTKEMANDMTPSSPSIINKDGKSLKKFNSNNIAPSQIQVTYWKDDHLGTNQLNLGSTQSSSAGQASTSGASSKTSSASSSRNQKLQSNKAETMMKSSKTDAIAERIVTAARAANSKKT